MTEKTHILIVEDEKQIARFLQMELEHEGYECGIEYNGAAALDRIGQEHFDLILLDIMLPDVDGLTICKRTRELSNVPIMMLSAKDDIETKVVSLDIGANDYLTKPVNPAALYAALEEWLPGGLAHNPMREAERPEENADGATPPAVPPSPPLHQAINAKAGLATVGGNEKLYNELLVRFVEHYGQSAAQLRDLLEHGDYRGAARLAHTVKGVAANLGVEQITELTRQMED